SLAIGNGATATVVSNGASGAIAIGYGAVAHQHANSGSVAIGYLASSTDVGSVALGQNAAANSQSSIAIGVSSTGATSGVAIGANATVGGAGSIAIGSSASSVQSGQGGGIAIGLSSNVTNAYSIAIGRASVSAYSNSIVLGHSAVSTAANQLVIGGATTISQGYIGNGVTATSPQSFTLNATGGSGTDIQGANIAIAGGRGTGSAAGGNILFQTSAAGTSGTTLNALSERMRITSNGDIGINNTNPQSVIDVGARSSTDSAYMSLRSGSTSSVRSAVRFYQGTTEYGNVGFVSSTNLTLQGLNRNITVATSTNNSSIELATCSACASSSDSTRHRLLVTTSGLSYQDGNNVAYMTLNRTSGTFAQAISIGTTSNMGQLGILNNNASQVGLAVQAASGQTANIQEWRDSNGANLLAVDSGGVLWGRDLTSGFRGSLDLQSSNNALILRNTNTQAFRIGFIGPNDAELSYGGRVNVNGLYTFSGNYVSFSNNIRGYNVAVSASSTEKTVTFATAHANANYAVFCTPNWNTSCYVTDKTTTGFKLNYSTPAPSGQLVDWFVAR
ncbi:hypothetical protein KDA11_06045, partial [Candidatus Saccharibacteria bacterium]|nr:hypothetical protein [Candidatus Saccharibacteria bacterium]